MSVVLARIDHVLYMVLWLPNGQDLQKQTSHGCG